jgi:hypothetical protein
MMSVTYGFLSIMLDTNHRLHLIRHIYRVWCETEDCSSRLLLAAVIDQIKQQARRFVLKGGKAKRNV